MVSAKFRSLFTGVISAAVLLVQPMAHAQDDELLEPEKAFAFSAEVIEPGLIRARWSIADDYYLYRDKVSFQSASGAPVEYSLPEGKQKKDPVFGDVTVYTQVMDIDLRVANDTQQLTLIAKGQGCNEPVGVCYPPQSYEVPLSWLQTAKAETLAMVEPAGQAFSLEDEAAAGELKSLLAATDSIFSDDDLLPQEDAFSVDLVADGEQLNAEFQIANGYYLYKDQFKITSADGSSVRLELPEGTVKDDPYFGTVEVYLYGFIAPVVAASGSGDETQLMLEYQGCADAGVCYPPMSQEFSITLPVKSAAAAKTALSDSALVAPNPTVSEQPQSNATLEVVAAPASQKPVGQNVAIAEASGSVESKGLLALLLLAFIAGIGLTFTPCVLPLIPILSSVIAGQGGKISTAKAGLLALCYVLGTAVSYAAIGAIAGGVGEQLQAYFQNVWAIGFVATIFVIMALSMFGLFSVQLPSFLQSRMQQSSNKLRGGSLLMVFLLGMISALIVGACVSPVLIGFLTIAIQQGSPLLGALIMFVMALGMGVPLVLLGLGAGHLLPKAGAWMDSVKYVFGVLLLAMAIYILSVLPQTPVLLLWAALLVVVAVYLGATENVAKGASGWRYLAKGVGIFLMIWGVLALLGFFQGGRDILKPLNSSMLSGVQSSVAQSPVHLFTTVADEAELEKALVAAKAVGKKVMIDYYADWCTDCVRMEKTTFAHAAVVAQVQRDFVALQVDLTDPKDPRGKALKKRYGVFGPPAMLFIDENGGVIADKAFYGYKSPEQFLAYLSTL